MGPGHRRGVKLSVEPAGPIQQRLEVVSNFGGLTSSAAAAMESLTTADNQLKTGSAVGAVYAADATTVGGLQRRNNHELVSNFYAVRLNKLEQ